MNIARFRRFGVALAAILATVILAGCVNLGIDSQFNADGSARYTVSGAIDKSALDQLSQFSRVDTSVITNQDQARQLAEQNGLEYEPIDTPDQTGAKFSKTYPDSTDIGAAITELYSAAQSLGATPLPLGAIAGTYTRDASNWSFSLTIDSDAVIQSFGVGANATITPELLSQYLSFTYTATFPGTVEATDGTKLSGNKVKWNLPLTGTTTLTANGSNTSKGSGSLWLIVAIVAGVLVLAGVVIGYLLVTRRRTTPSLEAAPVPAASPDPEPESEPTGSEVAEEPAPTGLDPQPESSDTSPEPALETMADAPTPTADIDSPADNEETVRIPPAPRDPQ